MKCSAWPNNPAPFILEAIVETTTVLDAPQKNTKSGGAITIICDASVISVHYWDAKWARNILRNFEWHCLELRYSY